MQLRFSRNSCGKLLPRYGFSVVFLFDICPDMEQYTPNPKCINRAEPSFPIRVSHLLRYPWFLRAMCYIKDKNRHLGMAFQGASVMSCPTPVPRV